MKSATPRTSTEPAKIDVDFEARRKTGDFNVNVHKGNNRSDAANWYIGDTRRGLAAHEYGHLIENRMIGKGGNRAGHHAGAMGESSGDLLAVEYLNEYGFVPVGDANPFAVGSYATGSKDRGIRNFGMNFPRTGAFPEPGVTPDIDPLNFSDMGYDLTGPQVHADGEIWSATNFDIRQAFMARHDAEFPSGDKNLQRRCADGLLP